jgi:hypothetical protein
MLKQLHISFIGPEGWQVSEIREYGPGEPQPPPLLDTPANKPLKLKTWGAVIDYIRSVRP